MRSRRAGLDAAFLGFRYSRPGIYEHPACYHLGMAETEANVPPDVDDPSTAASIKVALATKATLDRLAQQLNANSLGDLIAFLAQHFESSGHLTRFIDVREFHVLADRLQTVLLFLATTNLELGQHLRRIHSGHYRRLAQHADELVVLHNRLLAPSRVPAPSQSHQRHA